MVVTDGERADALPQHASDLASGGVARVQHAPYRVRRLAPERRTSAGIHVELRAPLGKLADVLHTLFNEHADRRLVTQPVARPHGIGRMKRRAVVVSDGGGDAALRVPGVALGRFGLRQDQHAAGGRQADGGAQSGDSASDDEKIRAVGRQSG